MSENFKKICYDSNPHFKIHHSFGNYNAEETLNYLHYDQELIVEFYAKGETCVRIEGNLYEVHEGDVLFLNPDEVHVSAPVKNCYMEKIVIHVSETLLQLFGGDHKVFLDSISKKSKGKGNLISADVVHKRHIDKNIKQCLAYAKENTLENQVLTACKIIEVLAELSKLVENDEDFYSNSFSSNKTINRIVDYINRHYTEEITLDVLAKRFHFSKYYISHLFKEQVGISPYEYLISRRLYVCNNLIRTNHTIKEACFLVGFNNYANFYRLYKKHFKITPQQFKEQLRTEFVSKQKFR